MSNPAFLWMLSAPNRALTVVLVGNTVVTIQDHEDGQRIYMRPHVGGAESARAFALGETEKAELMLGLQIRRVYSCPRSEHLDKTITEMHTHYLNADTARLTFLAGALIGHVVGHSTVLLDG